MHIPLFFILLNRVGKGNPVLISDICYNIFLFDIILIIGKMSHIIIYTEICAIACYLT
jgi:hypothetical protein